jgi:hypothetical protein
MHSLSMSGARAALDGQHEAGADAALHFDRCGMCRSAHMFSREKKSRRHKRKILIAPSRGHCRKAQLCRYRTRLYLFFMPTGPRTPRIHIRWSIVNVRQERPDERAAIENLDGSNNRVAKRAAETSVQIPAGGALHACARSEMAGEARLDFRPKIEAAGLLLIPCAAIFRRPTP